MGDIKKLLCTGDSLTDRTLRFPNGTDVQGKDELPILTAARGNRNLHWSDLLARELGCEMVNTGIGGLTAKAMLPKLDEMVFSHKPSHVLLNIGSNDLAPWNGFGYEETLRNVREIVKKICEHGIVCWIWSCSCNLPGNFPHDKLSLFWRFENDLNGIAWEFRSKGCKNIRIWDYTWGHVPEQLKVSDRVHSSVEGNFLIAKKLYDSISSFD